MSFQFIQGRTNNRLTWVGVDSADFATRESNLSAAWKIKVYGGLETQTGVNFITSGTGSLTNDIQHVGASAAGVYTIALAKADLSDASAAWYDEYVVILSATGAAYETFIVEGVRADTSYVSHVLSGLSAIVSDIYSALAGGTFTLGASNASDIASAVWAHTMGTRVDSRMLLTQSMASDAASAAQQGNSRILLVQSRLSDLDSRLVSDISDILSTVRGNSDALSKLQGASYLSDIASQVWAHTVGARLDSRVLLNQSRISDTYSMVVAHSDLLSQILADVTGLAGVDTSDIASAVWAQHWTGHSLASSFGSAFERLLSNASDAMSAAQQANSRILLTQSQASDIYSLVTAGVGLTISAMSDIASQVWAHTVGTRVDSRLLLVQSRLSDLDSRLLSDVSDILSAIAVGGGGLTVSNISDIASAVWAAKYTQHSALSSFGSLFSDVYSRLVLTQSAASDAMSAAQQTNSRVLLVQSRLSDLDSRLVSDVSDILSAVRGNSDAISALRAYVVVMSGMLSDTYSAASNINSMLLGGTFALGASNLSDIGSTVWAQHWTGHSLASSFGSAFERLLSAASDAASGVSDLRSLLITTGVLLTASTMSDIASQVWAHTVGTRVDSRLLLTQSMASDAASAAQQTNSRVLLVQSRLSDLDSRLVSDLSDVRSAIATTPSAVWATALATKLVQLNPSDLSDLRSAITAAPTVLSVSDLSDIASAVWAHTVGTRVDSRVLLNLSRISDVYSLLSDTQSDVLSLLTTTGVQLNASSLSDLRSAIGAITVTIGPSDISDIASAVRAILVSDLSDILSGVRQTNSRTLLVESDTSNIYSLLTAGVTLDASTMSDLRSAIGAITVTIGPSDVSDIASAVLAGLTGLTPSDISDIASAVRAILVSDLSDILSGVRQTNSRTLLVESDTSNIYSLLQAGVGLDVSTISDLRSAIAGTTLSVSDLSDIASAVWGHPVGTRVDSRILVNQSRVSDVYSLLSDTQSDMLSLLTTTGVQLNASSLSDLRSAIGAITVTIGASDVSDIASAVLAGLTGLTPSDISDIASAVRALLVSDLSDILSGVRQTNSRTLLVESDTSNIYSLLTAGVGLDASSMSDLRSAITAAPTTLSVSDISDIASAVRALLVSDLSDILSGVRQTNSRTLLAQSDTSNIYSLLQAGTPLDASSMSDIRSAIATLTTTLSPSDISDIASAVWATALSTKVVTLNTSDMSDLRSAIGAITVTIGASDVSDIASAVLAGLTGLTPSDISDIASAVRAILISDLSDILSGVRQTNSRTLLVESDTSNIYSLLQAGVSVDASSMSDLRSAIAAAAVMLDASTMSNIASQVWAHPTGQRVDSRLLVQQSRVSDIYSLLSHVQSDFQSRVPALVATQAQLSDVHSQTMGYLAGLSAATSDTYSLTQKVVSQTLAGQGQTGDIYSLLSRLESDVQSRFPAQIPELTGNPGATPTWAQQAALQFMWLRNSSKSTSTRRFLRNDIGATVLSAIIADAGGSFVQGRLG